MDAGRNCRGQHITLLGRVCCALPVVDSVPATFSQSLQTFRQYAVGTLVIVGCFFGTRGLVLYWLGVRAAQRAQGRVAWLVVLGGALVSGGLLLWMYPIDAADIFDNIMHGRILGV